MLALAITSNGASFSVLGNSEGAVHCYYGGQDDQGNKGGAGAAFVTYDNQETPPDTDFEGSAISTFRFLIWFNLVDVLDQDKAVAVIQQAMRTVFRERGKHVFDTYLTDNGPNRLGKSGEITYALEFLPPATDMDEPQVLARVAIELGHVQPLV